MFFLLTRLINLIYVKIVFYYTIFIMKTELLSPAKNKETAFEAINCGADAIYIGANSFGARVNAGNSLEDIDSVVNYAHKFWVKVYVTVNTILSDSELDEATELVIKLDKIGVDAIIVQDMGLLERLSELNLRIGIHISTQCDNRFKEKVDFFDRLGVKRVVLARELSIEQIKEIHNHNSKLELEFFVHGALCVSYSGQCYLSQYIGGRSANRGECAQPCRKKYTVLDDKGNIIAENIHPLCLKDFNASENIEKMIKAGIYSFKIEGRLKDVNYVKNITAYYRTILDRFSEKSSSGKSFINFIPNPEKSFNRGFTDYFLNKRGECYNFLSPKSRGEYLGKITEVKKDFFVIKTNKQIHPQDGLCFYAKDGLEGFLVNRTDKNKIYPNKKIQISVGEKIYRNLDVEFEKELSKPVKRQIGLNVSFKDNILTLTDEDKVSVKITLLTKEVAKNQEKMNETFIKQFSKTGESDFYINNIEVLSDVPFMPVSKINDIRRESLDKLMQERIRSYKMETQKHLKPADFYIKELDYRANIHNKAAKEFYENCGCKVLEMSMESKIPTRQIELMRTKHCIKFALGICKSAQTLSLKDEKGVIYPLKFDCKNCEMAVLSPN